MLMSLILFKEILKCKADQTAVRRYILLSPNSSDKQHYPYQGHKMLREHGKKRLQDLKIDEIRYRYVIG